MHYDSGMRVFVVLSCILLIACGGSSGPTDGGPPDGAADAGDADGGDVPTFLAVTFNTGLHPTVGEQGFTAEMEQYLDDYYGHGLCWGPALEEAKSFLQALSPDIVTFQEIFDMAECADIPPEARAGFVCEGWEPGAPGVAERILGPDYQVACHLEASDKCAAVRKDFGSIEGCESDLCYDGLFGSRIEGCGSRCRVGRGRILLAGGHHLTLVSVHGSSGFTEEDQACRVAQVEQVFVDLGDGQPAADGTLNLIMGDFNTDPRDESLSGIDPSARRWADFVGESEAFHFINERIASYADLFCIDNLVSDQLTGDCWVPGYSEGHPTVSPEGFFDHEPTVCRILLP